MFRGWISETRKSAISRITYSRTQRIFIDARLSKCRQTLEQIKQAWFSYHTTKFIKIRTFALHHTHNLMKLWFKLKLKKSRKWVRRLSTELFGIN